MTHRTFSCILLAVGLCACTKNYEGNTYMSFDNVRHVTSFAYERVHSKVDAEKITSSYGKNFRIVGQYLVEESGCGASFWRVTDMQTGITKSLAHKGHGEHEFVNSPRLNEVNIYLEDGHVHCLTNDYSSGKTFDIDISMLFADSVYIKRCHDMTRSSFNALIFSDSTYMYRAISAHEDEQMRFVVSNGEQVFSPSTERLNEARIPVGEDFNILSSIMAYHRTNGLILEAPVCLNTLSIYNVEGSVELSVCYGVEEWSIQDMLRQSRNDRCYTFENPRIYDNCCAVLWLGDTRKAYFGGNRRNASILVFDLDGNGLAKFDFDFMITNFEIDPQGHRIYVRDGQEGNIYAYDCMI